MIPNHIRKGNAQSFPEIVRADPRLLDQMERRTPRPQRDWSCRQFPGGAIIDPMTRNARGASSACVSWKPTFSVVATVPKVTFSAGTVSGLLPSNYGDLFTVDPDSLSLTYFKLVVTHGVNNAVTDVTIEVNQTDNASIPVTSPSAPTSYRILLGVYLGARYCMLFDSPISLTLSEVQRSAAAPSFFGGEPFVRHYTWNAV